MSYEFHAIASIFPLLDAGELEALVEDVRVHGLREPICLYEGKILDGRNRCKACEVVGIEPSTKVFIGTTLEAIDYVWSLNRNRRHLSSSQAAIADAKRERMYETYKSVKEDAAKRERGGGMIAGRGRPKPRESIPQAKAEDNKTRSIRAKVAGTNPKYVDLADRLVRERPDIAEKVESGQLTLSRAKKDLDREQDKAELEAAASSISDKAKKDLSSVCDLRCCSMQELFKSGIKPDCVITDPPYPEEFLSLFGDLAMACAKAKVPLVAVMSGQTYLPRVMSLLCEHLTYRWTLAYMTPGAACRLWQLNIDTTWKPVLLFGGEDYIFDVFKSDSADKAHHGWGQSESGMADLVGRLSKPGQLVCDPFMGGGTTALVSLALGRRFVGCDIAQECIDATRTRCEAMYATRS
jgi:hypothetical protein